MELTQEHLKQLLNYDPETGIFIRKKIEVKKGNNQAKAGDAAGWINNEGYLHIKIDTKTYKSHRLAFLYMLGEFPKKQVDHIDGVKLNNKWKNLRDVSHSSNQRNQKVPKNNTTGVIGVYYDKRYDIWVASIGTGVNREYLGCSKDKQKMIDIRRQAEIKYGYHENHGKRS